MIATEAKPHTAPIFVRRCPVHSQLVAFDGDGRLLGRCSGCIEEAAIAERVIQKGQAVPV